MSASDKYAHALHATLSLEAAELSLHGARNGVWSAMDGEDDALRDDIQSVMDRLTRVSLRTYRLKERLSKEMASAKAPMFRDYGGNE